jgi:thiol-disulfide isomerase/thioredoxin
MIRASRFAGFVLVSIFAAAWLAGGRTLGVPADGIGSFSGNAGWLNGPPLDPAQLRGKVVLVDFWEYTCLNCLRTLPYLREWYRRYADRGFVIVGAHTPEFDFSAQRANVAAGAQRLDVTWPIVLDNEFAIWKRYGNNVWPHEYLYDQNGSLVESFVGEGGYPETEAKIQALLKNQHRGIKLPPVMALLPQDSYDKPGAVCYPHTPELLVGRMRIANAPTWRNLAQDTNYRDDASNPKDGAIYLNGYWHLTPEAAVSGERGAYIALKYSAIQVVVVIKPEGGGAIRVDVTQDGKPVAKGDAGKDIRYDDRGGSYVTVDAGRSYDLITNARYGKHDLRLSPNRDGAGIYDFDFESCEIPGAK